LSGLIFDKKMLKIYIWLSETFSLISPIVNSENTLRGQNLSLTEGGDAGGGAVPKQLCTLIVES
jgi:hypothetical protein